jgi:hypothetical protein
VEKTKMPDPVAEWQWLAGSAKVGTLFYGAVCEGISHFWFLQPHPAKSALPIEWAVWKLAGHIASQTAFIKPTGKRRRWQRCQRGGGLVTLPVADTIAREIQGRTWVDLTGINLINV